MTPKCKLAGTEKSKCVTIIVEECSECLGCEEGLCEDPLAINAHVAEDDEEPVIADPDGNMGEMIEYEGFSGYLVKPMEGSPGVVMIHEWWGLNQNIKNMAHDMASEGFTVLAVDLYDGNVADNAADARTYATNVRNDMDTALAHLSAATNYLRDTGSESVASMGWCFGGGMSMQLALNEEMDATVIYYGAVETDEEVLSSISWPVLGVFGEDDTAIPVESVRAFDLAMDTVGIENDVYIYEGVGHAFANPSNPGHDVEKTKDAWMKTVEFLKKNLE